MGFGGSYNNRGGYSRGANAAAGGDPSKPDTVAPLGLFMHACEGDLLIRSTTSADAVPFFNAHVFLENKAVVGRVDEIFGPINEAYFSVKPAEGVVAASFKKGDKLFVGSDKLLPLERFLPRSAKPSGAGSGVKKAAGAARFQGGGGRGGFAARGRGGRFPPSRGGRGGGGGRGFGRGRGSFRGRGGR